MKKISHLALSKTRAKPVLNNKKVFLWEEMLKIYIFLTFVYRPDI